MKVETIMVCHFNLFIFYFKDLFVESPIRKNERILSSTNKKENTQSQEENGTSQSDTNQSNGNFE